MTIDHFLQKQMYCQVCSDKTRARSKEDDAQNRYWRVEEIVSRLKREGFDPEDIQCSEIARHRHVICRVNVHTMCGHCHEAERYVDEANRLGEQIAVWVVQCAKILPTVKAQNEDLFHWAKHTLTECLRGFYPMAASMILRVC